MDTTQALKNAIEFAKQNPDSEQAVQLRKRIESGMYKNELSQIQKTPFEQRNVIQKTLGAFLDPIIETGVRAGQAVGDVSLTAINKLAGGALDKYTPEGNLDQALQRAENTTKKVPVLGTVIKPVKDITAKNVAGNAIKTVALGASSPVVAGGALMGGEALSEDKGMGEVALNTVVGALGGKVLELGFNAVAPYIEKAVLKYGKPALDKLSQYIPESAKGFAENLASKVAPIKEGKILPETISKTINKVDETLTNIDKNVSAKIGEKGKSIISTGKEKLLPTKTSDEIAGMIAQGKTTDVPIVKRTLEFVDTTGVSTQKELQTALEKNIKPLALQVDSELRKDTTKRLLKDLSFGEKTSSGKVVKTNYVDESLKNLKELYKKTGDKVSETEIADLVKRAKTEGLTYEEINNISRKYNSEFGNKAFSKVNGDPLTSVNAQKFENIRMGLKDTARQGLSGDEAKYLDSRLSDLYHTKTLVDKQVEAVNKEMQKTGKPNIIQSAVRKLIKTADMLTGSPLKSIAKEIGLKDSTMSAVEIESKIKKGLEIIKKNKTLNESEIEQRLMNIFSDVKKPLKTKIVKK